MKIKKFLFLEIKEENIVYLLSVIRYIFSKKHSKTSIHVTLKGPQEKFRNVSSRKFMEHQFPLKIDGAGMFNNNGIYIVYLKVVLNQLKSYQMWYKPDFKGEFNPHITIYQGEDEKFANEILKFLLDEINCIETSNYDLTPYQSKQTDIFNQKPALNGSLDDLVRGGVVREDIFHKAQILADRFYKPD